MYNIIAFAIIILSLSGILYIIIRKFPSLIVLQTGSSPEALSQQTKAKIVRERLKRHHEKIKERISPFAGIISNFFAVKFHTVSRKIKDLEEKYDQKRKSKPLVTREDYQKQEKQVEQVLDAAEKEEAQNDFEGAERKYIEALSIDPKNVEVYEKLGELYIEYEKWEEARQTYDYITKLEPGNHKAFAQLAKVEAEEQNFEQSIIHYDAAIALEPRAEYFHNVANLYINLQDMDNAIRLALQAKEIEPENPKYVDALVEVALLAKDKPLAEEALALLREINPENQKIERHQAALEQL